MRQQGGMDNRHHSWHQYAGGGSLGDSPEGTQGVVQGGVAWRVVKGVAQGGNQGGLLRRGNQGLV